MSVRLISRPNCFCGLEAVALRNEPLGLLVSPTGQVPLQQSQQEPLYSIPIPRPSALPQLPSPSPAPSPWSSPLATRGISASFHNTSAISDLMVYECHFTPKPADLKGEECRGCLHRKAVQEELSKKYAFLKVIEDDGLESDNDSEVDNNSENMVTGDESIAEGIGGLENCRHNKRSMPTKENDNTLDLQPGGVCGFHMHAIEWQAMEKLGVEESLALAKSAHCPSFMLSIVRYLGVGIDVDFEIDEVTSIKCLCNLPTRLTLSFHSKSNKGTHHLVCPNSVSVLMPNNRVMRDEGFEEFIQDPRGQDCKFSVALKNASAALVLQPIQCWKTSSRLVSPVVTLECHQDDFDNHRLKPCLTHARFKPRLRSDEENKTHSRQSVTFQLDPTHISGVTGEDANHREDYEAEVKARYLQLIKAARPQKAEAFSSHSNSFSIDDNSETLYPRSILSALTSNEHVKAMGTDVQRLLEYTMDNSYVAALEKQLEKKRALRENRERKRVQAEREFEKQLLEMDGIRRSILGMQQNEATSTKARCQICLEGILTHAFVPCFHLVLCKTCSDALNECVVCRQPKKGMQQILWG